MLYKTKYEKQLDSIKLNEKIISLIREYNKLIDDNTEIKKNNLKIKFYEAQTRLYRQKAKKLKKSPEGKEIGEILSYNTFGQSEEECIKEQKEEFNKKFEELLKKSLEQ